MERLYELRDTLCDELNEYANKGKIGASDLEAVDKLTHTIKNLDKIIEKHEDGEYSGRYSMARKRDSRGRYASEMRPAYSRRDGYSYDMVSELHSLRDNAPDERTRMEFDKFIKKMEMM